MKILIILPNWLGDALMCTPAIELLSSHYPQAKFTFVGSFVSIEALKHHPKCEYALIDETKKAKSRILSTYTLAKKLGAFDLAITFRNQIHSSLLLRFTKSIITIARASWHSQLLLSNTPKISTQQHLVKQYVELAFSNINTKISSITPLTLYIKPKTLQKPTLGINAGATYGSAKRWYPDRFASVAAHYANKYDILIFGGPNEVEMAQEIEKNLVKLGVQNFKNIAGKTTIIELCSYIGGCSLFVTNDSGPMHIAAAYQVPTLSIFGPTKHKETSQWMNKKSKLVRDDIECSPCMKRECPLKHHNCMKNITASNVIEAMKELS